MNDLIAWIAAEADPKAVIPEIVAQEIVAQEIVNQEIVASKMVVSKIAAKGVLAGARSSAEPAKKKPSTRGMVAHTFPARTPITAAQPPPFAKDAKDGPPTLPKFPSLVFPASLIPASRKSPHPAKDAKYGAPGTFFDDAPTESVYEVGDEDRVRRIYRGRTVAMLRRYMRYSIETGRLPSLLGGEFFRAKVTTYTVVTFEDRVIFVHDMEKCLGRLDEFSRQLLARNILQEHDQAATGRILQCTERTVRTLVPVALDVLSAILLEVGLLERVESTRKNYCPNSCQGGKTGPFDASDCEHGKYKV